MPCLSLRSRWLATTLLLLALPALAEAKSTGHKPLPPKAPKPSVEAVTARSTSEAFLRSGKLDDALEYANQAAKLAPEWPDVYALRARIELALAGPSSELAALEKPDTTHDYQPTVSMLAGAKSDLETYVKLAPDAAQGDGTVQLLGEVSARTIAAQKAQAASEQRAKEDELSRQAAERQRTKELEQLEAARVQAAAEAQRQLAEAQRQWDQRAKEKAEADRRAAEADHQRALAEQRAAYDASVASAASGRHSGYVVGGIGLGLGATALVLKSVADGKYNALKTTRQSSLDELVSAKKSGDTFTTLALATAALGGTMVAIAVPIVLGNLTPEEPKFSFAPAPGGAAMVLTGSLP